MGGLTTAGQIPPPGKNITVKISQTLSKFPSHDKDQWTRQCRPRAGKKKNLKKSKKMTPNRLGLREVITCPPGGVGGHAALSSVFRTPGRGQWLHTCASCLCLYRGAWWLCPCHIWQARSRDPLHSCLAFSWLVKIISVYKIFAGAAPCFGLSGELWLSLPIS